MALYTSRLTTIDDWLEHWLGLVMIDLAHSRLSLLFTRHSPCTKAARNLPRVASVCLLLPASSSHSHSLTATTVPILITEICWVSKMPLSHNSQTGCTCTVYPCPLKLLRQFFLYSFGLYLFIFCFVYFCYCCLLIFFFLFSFLILYVFPLYCRLKRQIKNH